MIKRKGTIVSFGNASGAVPDVPLFKLTPKNVKLMRPTYVPFHWYQRCWVGLYSLKPRAIIYT